MKSFDSRSRSAASTTIKSVSGKHPSRHTSIDVPKKSSSANFNKGQIQANEDNSLYKEIILRQHAVPLGDLLQTTES
jgi:hypothetical protein